MSRIFQRQFFSPSCKLGGNWYSCGSGSRFVGCCVTAPCDHGCPDGNLKPASFDKAYYGKFSDQQCPTESHWYTCTDTNPPFMGCCKSSPCAQSTGCPEGNLTAGFLSSNPSLAAEFNPSGGSSAAISSPTASPSQPDVTSSPSKSSHTGAIAGGAVGGVVVIALLIALLLFYYKKKSSKSRQNMIEPRVAPEKPVPMYPESNSGTHDAKHSPLLEKEFPTPAPAYPNSPSLPSYPHSPSEMDSQPYLKPKQSLSQNFHQTYSTSGDYLPSALGLNAPSPNHNGRYTAYSTTNSPTVLSPLASPVVELDGTTSANAPSRHA